MRNVQTQAQTWASVSPYADYNEGLIVLTGRGWEGVAVAAATVQSHSTSPPSETGQIYSFCLSGEQTAITKRNEVTPTELMRWLMILIRGSRLF